MILNQTQNELEVDKMTARCRYTRRRPDASIQFKQMQRLQSVQMSSQKNELWKVEK